ncbi:hypothetical protein [Viscerimonas tarda]
MNTFFKIALGFVLGVVCTIGVLFLIANTKENQLKEEIRNQLLENLKQSLNESNEDEPNKYEPRNIQSFELSTKNGIVKLHTYMPKDSVQILMGRPQSTDVNDMGILGIRETWEYKGRNRYTSEFTIEFTDGELKSVRQYRES